MSTFLYIISPLALLTLTGGLLAAWLMLLVRPDSRMEESVINAGGLFALLSGLWIIGLSIYQHQLPILTPGQTLTFLAVLIWSGHSATQIRIRQHLLSVMPLIALQVLLLTGIAAGLEPDPDIPEALRGVRPALHITLSLAGVAMLLGSGVFGAGQLVLHRQIKGRRFGMWYQQLPSLSDLDRLRRMTLAVGWALVSLSLGSAMVSLYLDNGRNNAMLSHLHPMLTLWALITLLAVADRYRWVGSRRLAQGSLLLCGLMVLLVVVSVVEVFTGRFL